MKKTRIINPDYRSATIVFASLLHFWNFRKFMSLKIKISEKVNKITIKNSKQPLNVPNPQTALKNNLI